MAAHFGGAPPTIKLSNMESWSCSTISSFRSWSGIHPNDAHVCSILFFFHIRHGENRTENYSGVPVYSTEGNWCFILRHWFWYSCFAFPNTCVVSISHPHILGEHLTTSHDSKNQQNNEAISGHGTLIVFEGEFCHVLTFKHQLKMDPKKTTQQHVPQLNLGSFASKKKGRLAPAMEGKDLRSSLHSLRDHQDLVGMKGEDKWSGDMQFYTWCTCFWLRCLFVNFWFGLICVWSFKNVVSFRVWPFAASKRCLLLRVDYKNHDKNTFRSMKNKNHLSNLKSMVIFWDLVFRSNLYKRSKKFWIPMKSHWWLHVSFDLIKRSIKIS